MDGDRGGERRALPLAFLPPAVSSLFPLLRAEFVLTNAELGLVFSLVSLAPIFCNSPFGRLVDRVGEKRVLVLGTLSVDLSIPYAGRLSCRMGGSLPLSAV